MSRVRCFSAIRRPVAALFIIAALSDTIATGASNTTKNQPCEKANRRAFLDSCLLELPPMLTSAQLTGLPKSKQEVDTLCNAFKTGMKCFEEYSNACLSLHDRQIMDQTVAGAKQTFRFLCDDKKFQAEYLLYTSCYRGMSRDWDSCANRYMGFIREEVSRKNVSDHTKLIGLCCAKFGFLRCIFVTSRYKCEHKAAIFLHRIADTLANVGVYTPAHSPCQGVTDQVCTAGASPTWSTSPFFVLIVLLLLLAPL